MYGNVPLWDVFLCSIEGHSALKKEEISMASNYTSNYSLCQWAASDKVLRTDFNADNAKIDAAIKAVNGRVDGKASTSSLNSLKSTVNSLSQTVSSQGSALGHRGNCQIELSSYIGDGADSRTHSFARRPLFFLVYGQVQMIICYGATLAYCHALDTHGVETAWSGNSVTLTSRSASTQNDSRAIANISGVTYHMFIFYDQSAV